jgi:hypothetical protein
MGKRAKQMVAMGVESQKALRKELQRKRSHKKSHHGKTPHSLRSKQPAPVLVR